MVGCSPDSGVGVFCCSLGLSRSEMLSRSLPLPTSSHPFRASLTWQGDDFQQCDAEPSSKVMHQGTSLHTHSLRAPCTAMYRLPGVAQEGGGSS